MMAAVSHMKIASTPLGSRQLCGIGGVSTTVRTSPALSDPAFLLVRMTLCPSSGQARRFAPDRAGSHNSLTHLASSSVGKRSQFFDAGADEGAGDDRPVSNTFRQDLEPGPCACEIEFGVEIGRRHRCGQGTEPDAVALEPIGGDRASHS